MNKAFDCVDRNIILENLSYNRVKRVLKTSCFFTWTTGCSGTKRTDI